MRLQALALCLVLAACSQPRALPTFNTIPEFTLTSHTGSQFRSAEQLKGRVWIADFIFTTCTGPCPRMSSQMRRVQESLADVPGIRVVSFTVDPNRDSPDVLAAYARRQNADPARWFFLTGPAETLHMLKRQAFLLGNVDGKNLDHSTRFVLVDPQGRVRQYYDTSEPASIPTLIADARRLADRPSG